MTITLKVFENVTDDEPVAVHTFEDEKECTAWLKDQPVGTVLEMVVA